MTVWRTLVASIALLAAGIGVLAKSTNGFRAFTSESALRLAVEDHPPLVPPLSLETASGKQTSFGDLRGRWLLVDFMYTRCLTLCSVQGGEFAQLQRLLAKPIAEDKLTLVSVSFDITHDDPSALAEYQHIHGDNGIGWIAGRPNSAADLATLMRVFGVVAVPDNMSGFVHNAAFQVVNPEGQLVAIMDWNDLPAVTHYITQKLAR